MVQIIDGVLGKQEKNNKNVTKEIKKLDEFAKMSNQLGFWKLLVMGLVSIAAFMFTMSVIMMTRWI